MRSCLCPPCKRRSVASCLFASAFWPCARRMRNHPDSLACFCLAIVSPQHNSGRACISGYWASVAACQLCLDMCIARHPLEAAFDELLHLFPGNLSRSMDAASCLISCSFSKHRLETSHGLGPRIRRMDMSQCPEARSRHEYSRDRPFSGLAATHSSASKG